MRLGVHITKFNHPEGPASVGSELAAAGTAAEHGGISWMSVMDHYFQMEQNGGAEDAMLEAYTTLGYLAARTSRVRLGVLVTGVTYRHPGLLAKIATTLDVLSGGRATLGLGAAWYDREHHGLGIPFPPLSERYERLEETLRICLQMWNPEDDGPFDGTHYRLAETLCHPQPVSTPHPEIMVGGGGEKKTLRLVARYADACNLFTSSPADVAHKLQVLEKHCQDAGRDPGDIRRTVVYTGDALHTGDVDGFLGTMTEYAGLGIDTVIVSTPHARAAQWIESSCSPAVERLAGIV
ncbi:LLM class F420-dependent oxidoreductase [Peterkaempfera griseoplana]|uniref:LLM class F420-dependent oxidoreductase n=1 Tax=Peterkaempfera griseoplana TaxID=66896 RepID=UPI0006E3DB5C|nr:LLM class F420-dependent oxidoreductase [Peterkaempfera griseoplana]